MEKPKTKDEVNDIYWKKYEIPKDQVCELADAFLKVEECKKDKMKLAAVNEYLKEMGTTQKAVIDSISDIEKAYNEEMSKDGKDYHAEMKNDYDANRDDYEKDDEEE